MAPVGQQVRFKISPYFCPRFQNDTGSEVWGFCVFYRQDAGIGFLPCCKWRSVSAHRSLTRLIHLLFKFRKYAPHALKGQKLLAQGIALGIQAISKAPCKGCVHNNPGRCPGLGASALYLSLRPVTVGSGRVGEILAKFQFIKYLRKLLACIFCKGIHRVPFICLLNFFCL